MVHPGRVSSDYHNVVHDPHAQASHVPQPQHHYLKEISPLPSR